MTLISLDPVVAFDVTGEPVTQGSMRINRSGRIYHEASRRLNAWRDAVSWWSKIQMGRVRPVTGPVAVSIVFRVRRPRDRTPVDQPDRKPDIDKLARAVLDAMTGIVYEDDAQIVNLAVAKRYAGGDGRGLSCGANVEVARVVTMTEDGEVGDG